MTNLQKQEHFKSEFMKIKKYLRIFLCLLLSFLIAELQLSYSYKSKLTNKSTSTQKSNSKKNKNSKTSNSKTKKSSKSKKKKKSKSGERIFSVKIEDKSGIKYEILESKNLEKGIVYKKYLFGKSKFKHAVHVIEGYIADNTCSIQILKAKNLNCELERLHQMVQVFDSTNGTKVYGAVNGSFWRAYSNTPIGPTIINGEIVELSPYKEWSSIMWDDKGTPYIDNFKISAKLKLNSNSFVINSVNHRSDSNQIVLYNSFGGDEIPFIQPRKMSKIMEETFLFSDENSYNDSTEAEFDQEKYLEEQKIAEQNRSLESKLTKLVLEYDSETMINQDIDCTVKEITNNKVKVPKNGCVITLATDFPNMLIPRVGENIKIRFETSTFSDVKFFNSVCGTPRIVRKGVAQHEAFFEGSKGKRFINGSLPRTAIGYNKDKTKIYLIAIEPTISSNKIAGANLTNLSKIAKTVGCYDAMNLDGGGSSIMLIDNENVLLKSNPSHSRKLSVGVGIIKK